MSHNSLDEFRKMYLRSITILKRHYEKATDICTNFIKCFLLSSDSPSQWRLVVDTTVNAMVVPPVDIVLGF